VGSRPLAQHGVAASVTVRAECDQVPLFVGAVLVNRQDVMDLEGHAVTVGSATTVLASLLVTFEDLMSQLDRLACARWAALQRRQAIRAWRQVRFVDVRPD